uniref:Uncharacterized protein n=1 Tax=Arundo donax TaxID=35708 RepID=A0A0A8Z8D5_ARUDO
MFSRPLRPFFNASFGLFDCYQQTLQLLAEQNSPVSSVCSCEFFPTRRFNSNMFWCFEHIL